MEIFLISFLVIVVAALAMALGAIAGRTPITAGCGNFAKLGDGDASCDICGGGYQEGGNNHDPIG
jgi:hypothetical protein